MKSRKFRTYWLVTVGCIPDALGLAIATLIVFVVNPRCLQQSGVSMFFFNTLDDIGATFRWLRDDAVMSHAV